MDDVSDSYTDILTKDYQYESAIEAGQPWTRYKADPWYYGTAIDPHFIPMIDDVMGFELRDTPSKPLTVEAKSGLKSSARRAVNSPSASSSVTRTYSYEMDMNTFRRAIPIVANRTDIEINPQTPVTVTIGFDDVGLLRFADVEISSVTATLGGPRTWSPAEGGVSLHVRRHRHIRRADRDRHPDELRRCPGRDCNCGQCTCRHHPRSDAVDQANFSTNASSWRRLRHSYTPSVCVP